MGKLLFIPFSIAGGLIAGFLSKKVFDLAWTLVDDEEPPEPEHRDVPWWKLAIALALEGAILRLMRGIAARGWDSYGSPARGRVRRSRTRPANSAPKRLVVRVRHSGPNPPNGER